MKFRPLHAQVAVKLAPKEEVSKGGIFLPESAREKATLADVVAVGPGSPIKGDKDNRRPVSVQPGDRVMLDRRAIGTKVVVDGEELHVFHESNVLAVMEKTVSTLDSCVDNY